MIRLNDYDLKILFIALFLYFIIVRKSVRTFTSEFTIFGGNNTLTLEAPKKCIFSFQRNLHISIYPDEDLDPHPSVC